MGVVFRARDTRLGREVALKTLPPESVSDPVRLQRFEAEARAASALNHPNVLAVFDVGREGDVPFLVTELLQGETLREKLAKGPLPPRKVIELAMHAAQGLAAVHEKGIVHRDLKPDNLFCTRDGQLKILDFGVARTTEGATPPTGTLPLTQSGAVMGTAGYMSPEQVRGRVADARSDLFALGAIVYECLSGHMAFPGETPVERGYAILNADPKPLVGVAAPSLERVMRRCLEKDPAERFQHARDLVFALEAISDSGVAPALPSPPPKTRGWWPAALGLGLVAVAAVLWFSRPPPAPRPVEAPVAAVVKPPTTRRVSFRNGSIFNARFTADGRGVAYAGTFENTAPRVYSGVLDGPQLRPASSPGTTLFDVSDKDELAIGGVPDSAVKTGMVLLRSSLAGGAARPLYEGVIGADFGPNDTIVLTRFHDAKFSIECPPGNVVVSSKHQVVDARLSPDGSMIAFLQHPVQGDDRGYVEIIDRVGKSIARSTSAWTLVGLAWNPNGKEVWFSAGYEDVSRRIHALGIDGSQRLVYGGPGSLRIMDVDAKGRVLAVTGIMRSRMFGKVAGDEQERSLSWLDGSMPLALSNDATALLFLEGYGPAGSEVQTWFRRFDQPDDTPVLLSLGWGRALSPDKQWAIITPTPPFNTLRIIPTGVGTQRDLPAGDFLSLGNVHFFPDGKRIAFSAVDSNNRSHLYVQSVVETGAEDIEASKPHQVGDEEWALAAPPSPDGKWLVGIKLPSREASLVPVDDEVADVKPLEKITPGDVPIQWSPDGKALWLLRRPRPGEPISVQLLKFEQTSGKTTPVASIRPADPVGMDHIKAGLLTPDGKHYVYTANQELDELYLIEGVR